RTRRNSPGAIPAGRAAGRRGPPASAAPRAAPADRRRADPHHLPRSRRRVQRPARSEEHTSELQSLAYLVCRLLLEKKKNTDVSHIPPPFSEPSVPEARLQADVLTPLAMRSVAAPYPLSRPPTHTFTTHP